MNIAHFLARAARAFPDNPAVSHGERTVATYAQLARRASMLAHGLRERFGLHAGERIALSMTNSPEYIEVLYAAWWAGLTAVPINAKLHPEEAAYILADSQARLCFVTADLAESSGALQARAPEMLGVIQAG